jgi:hypothetical protein
MNQMEPMHYDIIGIEGLYPVSGLHDPTFERSTDME